MKPDMNPVIRQARYRQHMLDHLKRIIQMDVVSCRNDADFEVMVNNMLADWVAHEINHYPRSFRSVFKVLVEQAQIRDLEREIDEILARIDTKALLIQTMSERMQVSLQLLNDNFSQLLNGDTNE